MESKLKGRPILVAIAAVFALMLGATAATAAQATFTVTAGSAADGEPVAFTANAVADNDPVRPNGEFILFRNETRGIDMTCETSTAAGGVTAGPSQPGAGIGDISSISWGTCVGLGIPLCPTADAGTLPWDLNATSESNGVTTGTISGIRATVVDCETSGDQCTFTVEGPNDTLGSVPAEYDNATQKLRTFAESPSNLIIDDVGGSLCPLVMVDDDEASYDSTYMVVADDATENPIAITQD